MKNNIHSFIRRVKRRRTSQRLHGSPQSEEDNEKAHTSTSTPTPRGLHQIHLMGNWQDNRRVLYSPPRPMYIPRKNLNLENNLNKEDSNELSERYRKGLGSSNLEPHLQVSATQL